MSKIVSVREAYDTATDLQIEVLTREGEQIEAITHRLLSPAR